MQSSNQVLCSYLFGHWVSDNHLFKTVYERYFAGIEYYEVADRTESELSDRIQEQDSSNPEPGYTAKIALAYAQAQLYRARKGKDDV